jgi:cytochrome P450
MRKDGEAQAIERRALFPSLFPKTVKNIWMPAFEVFTDQIINDLAPRSSCDLLVRDFAMPVSGEALKLMTGLTNMATAEMDRTSQGTIDGCSNYTSDPDVETTCHNCTASIDAHIDTMLPILRAAPDMSALSVQLQADLPMVSIRANIKLIISGGQNEPRDAIAGTACTLLQNPAQHDLIKTGAATYTDAFENTPAGCPRSACRRAVSRAPTPFAASHLNQKTACSSCSPPPATTKTISTPPKNTTSPATPARPSPLGLARISAPVPPWPAP